MRKRAFFTAVATATFMVGLTALGSCAGAPPAARTVSETGLRQKAEELTADLALDPRDEALVADGIGAFLELLAKEYGKDFTDALPRLHRPSDLNAYLASQDETTASRKVLDAFRTWDRSRKDKGWREEGTERTETAHFALITMPGTAAYKERDFIARACEEYLEASAAFLKPDEASASRFHKNMASLSGGKVVVLLPPNSRPFGNFKSASATNYAFSISGEQSPRIQVSIRLPYYNALSTTALAHEIAHVRDIMQKIDLSTAPSMSAPGAKAQDFKAWAHATFEKCVPNDRPFGEGIAEYAAARVNPIQRAFYAPPDAELNLLATQARRLNDILSQSVTAKDSRIRLVRYTELHSFVAYLIDTYGMNRFLDFYLRVPPDEANFIAAYGTDFAGMQIRWKEATR